MTTQRRSFLVVTPDAALSDSISAALGAQSGARIDRQATTLSQMNGKAARIAGDYDMILFQTEPGDLDAIRVLAAGRRQGASLVALANPGITLAEAQELNRAGVNEVLPIPARAADFGDQIARLGRTGQSGEAARKGRLIVVTRSRGGVGSTTVAVNLADQLVGRRGFLRRKTPNAVALVDFDLQFGTIGSFLDLEDQDALLQITKEGIIPDETFLRQAMVRMDNGLNVLAAPSKFAPLDSLRSDQVTAILDALLQSHDYVVVELPRALVGWIEPILHRADELILVTDIAVSSIRSCRRFLDFVTADTPTLPVRIVVNQHGRPLWRSRLTTEAEKVLQQKFDHWLPRDPVAATRGCDGGKPLSTAAPRSGLTKALSRLANATMKTFPATRPMSAR